MTGLRPFLARSTNGSLGLTFRPRPRLRLDESYIYSRLGAAREWLPDPTVEPGAIFNNHILRSKVNYQFSRELSLRAIFDYNGVLPNASLVSLDRSKRLGADVLLTYLLHPGTALYVGLFGHSGEPGFRSAAVACAAADRVSEYHYGTAGLHQTELPVPVLTAMTRSAVFFWLAAETSSLVGSDCGFDAPLRGYPGGKCGIAISSRELRCTGEQICSRRVRLVGVYRRHYLCQPRP